MTISFWCLICLLAAPTRGRLWNGPPVSPLVFQWLALPDAVQFLEQPATRPDLGQYVEMETWKNAIR